MAKGMMMKTRAEVEAYCENNEIELSVELWSSGTHVHANIDADHKIFRAHGLHNLALWEDDKSPRWDATGRELLAADFGDC